jgi:hypothetical protein
MEINSSRVLNRFHHRPPALTTECSLTDARQTASLEKSGTTYATPRKNDVSGNVDKVNENSRFIANGNAEVESRRPGME